MNRYEIFGFAVSSELVFDTLPKLDIGQSESDVTIRFGQVNRDKTLIRHDQISSINSSTFLLDISICSIWVLNGNEIVIYEKVQNLRDVIQLFVLGSSFAMLMMQRNNICFHGGFITYKSKNIIITGTSGAGKSSLVSFLLKEGGKLISDDVIRLNKHHNGLVGISSYPTQKVSSDVIKKYGLEERIIRKLPRFDTRDKFILDASDYYASGERKIDAIIELVVEDSREFPSIRRLTSKEAVENTLQHFYKSEYLPYMDLVMKRFEYGMTIAQSIPYFQLYRPKDEMTLVEQETLIADNLR